MFGFKLQRSAPPSKCHRRTRLSVESLEDRTVPATYKWVASGTDALSSEDVTRWRVNNQIPNVLPGANDVLQFTADGGAPCNLGQTGYDAIKIESGYNKTITTAAGGLSLYGSTASTIAGGAATGSTLNLQGHLVIHGAMTVTGTTTIASVGGTKNISVDPLGSLTISEGTVVGKQISANIINYGSLTLSSSFSSAVAATVTNETGGYMTLGGGGYSTTGSGITLQFQNHGTTYVSANSEIRKGGFVNHSTGALFVQANLTIWSSVTHEIGGSPHIASLVNDGGEINLYGGKTLTVDKSARIIGGTFYVLPDGTNYEATITGDNDFTHLLFSGATLRLGQIGNGGGKMTLDVQGANSVVHFENSASMIVTLDYDNGATGSVDMLKCRNLVAGGGTLTVNYIGTPKALPQPLKVVDCNPNLTLTQFSNYALPPGVSKDVQSNDILLIVGNPGGGEEEEDS